MKSDVYIEDCIKIALRNGLSTKECFEVFKPQRKPQIKYKCEPFNGKRCLFFISIVTVLIALRSPKIFSRPKEFFDNFMENFSLSDKTECMIGHSAYTLEITRKISTCKFCKDVKKIAVSTNMTREYFLNNHAYSGAPVLIKGGASNWSALNVFSYKYFKLLYHKMNAEDENDDRGCQFFPYKTNFRTLKQVFRMSKKRASLQKDQWYIGWSNCVPRVAAALRRHYMRPDFLPNDSESSLLDWMFMGGSGTGAQLHLDAVNRPSWQAMIKGKKTWHLEPPPECERICARNLTATMTTGDILVVDTNKWYHSTFIHPGNLSITIGSEFD